MPPRVNNFGHAVWYGPDGSNYNDWEIFFYDGATVHQVTDNIYDDQNPDINNNDEIVWVGYDGTRWNLYKATGVSAGVSISQEVSASALLHINNNGEVVWHGTLKGQYDYEIFYYNGGAPQAITSNSFNDFTPDINDGGEIVYTSKIDNYTYKLFLDTGGGVSEIYTGSYGANTPRINVDGEVVWSRYDYGYDEIFLYDGATTSELTFNSTDDRRPAINDDGLVVWDGGPYASHSIYLYIGGNKQVISTISDAREADINNKAQVVYQGYNGADTEIYLATPKAPNRYGFEYHFDNGAGDFYLGEVYAFPEYGYNVGQKWNTFHEGGGQGYYEITSMQPLTYLDGDRAGQVYVTSYHDQETNTDYTPVNYRYGLAASLQYLEHEYDWIIVDTVDDFKFGGGVLEADPTGTTYLVYQQWGGTWHDANKYPSVPDDNYMCWAAAAANVLEWGKWDTAQYDNAQDIFKHFQDHWTDAGSFATAGWKWWFDGTEPPIEPAISFVNVPGSGNFWPEFNKDAYLQYADTNLLPTLNNWFQAGYGVSAGFETVDGGSHAVTVWGFDYYTSGATRGYTGLWITDSDDYETEMGLFFVTLIWNASQNRWDLGGEYTGWYLSDLEALKFNPTPVAHYPFTYYYGNGDSYTGEVYGKNGDYNPEVNLSWDNELNLNGYYDITGRTFGNEVDQVGQVLVTSYFDSETNAPYTPVHAGQPVGLNLLGSEHDYIQQDCNQECFFGAGANNLLYEADIPQPVYETCYAMFTTSEGVNCLVVGLVEPTKITYLGFLNANLNQLSFVGQSWITEQGQDPSGHWEKNLFFYSVINGATYVGTGYCAPENGWYYAVNLSNTQFTVISAYAKSGEDASGKYYQYQSIFSNGVTYMGLSYAALPSGYFYGVPTAAPQTHFLGIFFPEGQYDLLYSPFWTLNQYLTLMDETS